MSDPSTKSTSTTPPPALEYDRSPTHVTRGQFRILLLLMFINTVAIVGYVALPGGSQWVRQAWADFQNKRAARAKEQRNKDLASKRIADFQKALPAMAAMKLPADTPVYTEDQVEAASLLASDSNYQTVQFERRGIGLNMWQPAVGRGTLAEAAALYPFIGGSSSSSRGITVFLHGRKNPAGQDRLVLCELDAQQNVQTMEPNAVIIGSNRSLIVRLIAPGSASESPKVLASVQTEFDQRPGQRARVKTNDDATGGQIATATATADGNAKKTPQTFRILPGMADPSDATRFSIPYVISGARGSFNGRIIEGDQLIIEPSEGRIADRKAGDDNSGAVRIVQTWDVTAPPAMKVSESASDSAKPAASGY